MVWFRFIVFIATFKYRVHFSPSTTLVVIGIDCTGSCKSNYHTITIKKNGVAVLNGQEGNDNNINLNDFIGIYYS